MPLVIPCPSCSRQVRVPEELAGRTVRCPSCEATFTAPARAAEETPAETYLPQEEPSARRGPPASPPPEREEELPEQGEDEGFDRPRRRRRRRQGDDAYGMVQGPAIALMVTSGISLGLSILHLLFF